jgi:hypothetical protein
MEQGLRAVVEPFALASQDREGRKLKYAPLGLCAMTVGNMIQRLAVSLRACGVPAEKVEHAVASLQQDPALNAAIQVMLLVNDWQCLTLPHPSAHEVTTVHGADICATNQADVTHVFKPFANMLLAMFVGARCTVCRLNS